MRLTNEFMQELKLFIDASVDPITKIGVGAYLNVLRTPPDPDELRSQVVLKIFSNTSSTKLELQTLIWALESICNTKRKIWVYTDCQNILGLTSRRERLERSGYTSRNNRQLENSLLYQRFFRIYDQLDCHINKVKGHKPGKEKDDTDRLFSLVDRAARRTLRKQSGAKGKGHH